MQESINLIPHEERIQQTKTKVVKMSTILTIFILVIMVGVGGFFYYKAYKLKQQIKNLDNNIASMRAELGKMSDIEISARNLYKKSSTLETILKERRYYSKMLQELNSALTPEIQIDSFTLGKEDSINLSGSAISYNDIQFFSNRLLERKLFTQVALNTVNLDTQKDRVSFFIVVNFNSKLLND